MKTGIKLLSFLTLNSAAPWHSREKKIKLDTKNKTLAAKTEPDVVHILLSLFQWFAAFSGGKDKQ